MLCQKRMRQPCRKQSWKKIPNRFQYSSKDSPIRSSSFEQQPPLWIPYVISITCLHKNFSSCPNLQRHILRRALLNNMIFFIPNPTLRTWEQTVFQFTRCILGSLLGPSQRKSLWRRSNLLAMSAGKGKRDKKYVRRLDNYLSKKEKRKEEEDWITTLDESKTPPHRQVDLLPTSLHFFHFLDYPVPNGFWYMIHKLIKKEFLTLLSFSPSFRRMWVLSSIYFKSNSNLVIKVLMHVHTLLSMVLYSCYLWNYSLHR